MPQLSENLIRITISVEENIQINLKRLSEEKNISLSALCRNIIHQSIKSNRKSLIETLNPAVMDDILIAVGTIHALATQFTDEQTVVLSEDIESIKERWKS